MLDKTYNPKQFEARWYKAWVDSNAFASTPNSPKAPYTIMMPPPNVTGSLHIGHALTFTLQDILIRYHRMAGRDALWQPGTDHAGIATQMVVERKLDAEGVKRRDLGRDKFVDEVWKWVDHSGGTISKQLQSLGASPDWARDRFTLDEGLSKAVRLVFVQMHQEGLIYRDKRLVNWDPKLQTAISDLEVEQRDVNGHYWHIRYPVENSDEHLVVATTRPETMFGDTAVAVHPDDPRYKNLIGKHVILPLMGRRIPVVADEYADMEKGSGAVKITPAHDFNDFEVGRRHDLDMINVMDAEGRMNDVVPDAYQGMDRFEARKKLVAQLEAENMLAEIEPTVHSVPHGDRSGVPLEPWLMDQWYVDAKTLAQPAIKAVEDGRTRFVPKRWEKTYFEWMRNIQPWCVSRQLWWGHRIPAWYGPDQTPFVAMDENAAMAAAREHYGKDVTLRQDEDVLDTWFSSGLWPFSTLGWPEETDHLKRYYPGDVLVTGFDIIFFWVARMMMMSMHFMDGEVPFKDVYIHALVRDEKGQKMSKSKGNVMDPLDISEKYGADALRFTLTALAAQGRDIKLAESRIEGYRNFATKIWNACRFLEMNNATGKPGLDGITINDPINQWILFELNRTSSAMKTAITEYRFNDAADTIYHFIWHQFCDWYLEWIKPVLGDENHSANNEYTRVAATVMAEAITMLHPLMPFITEELWKEIFEGENMLISSSWPERDVSHFEDAGVQISFVFDIISTIRSLRNEMNIPASAKPDLVLLTSETLNENWITDHRDAILRLARLNDIRFAQDMPPQSAQAVVSGVEIALPLAGVLDFDAEKKRLSDALKSTEIEVKKLESKLNNPGFVNKAPADVVEENKRRLDAEIEQRNKLDTAIKRLQ
ncbi:MAG: valine--tRNA ligase [Alphaproteobacteria bacterium]|jgi:valyl-tRNA synthetase|nr:valine--tRNA ligase [Alphaproteobacteria bacterium]